MSPAFTCVAVAGVDRLDDAAGRVLDHLPVALDLERAGGDHGAGDPRHRAPGAEAEDQVNSVR